MQTDAVATMVALEAVRQMSPSTRVYFAATSELFGDTTESPQNEQTRLWPSSPYGIAKLASFHAVRLWREAYGLFAANGILFNHESPRRGLNFVTRKITRYVAQLAIARQNPTNGPFYALQLGNLHSRRDWGHAKDYVRAMHAMLCHDVPMDFVIATGQTRSIRDLLTAAFSVIGVHDWKPYVITDTQDCVRPQDVGLLLGDASLAKRILGWEPTISFDQMIREMVENDIAELRAEERARVAT
jgi:GDPmannose 4,6-dehydratase